ncbi:VWA domain-containing protein [Kineosporia rhizophila]|uniref:vWA domain-containing protein n=1 Tax=Kineosporia TaxID=49184 RepID=UPI001E5425DB|nr:MULTISPECIES: VWA domain-containing protein [Kineosporia]MCE0536754.1 VWA domain-containing protein [Kineosporia rhizophila]GLY13096.1 VWA domain-containing protein [Kineosporia sp. NBRC 101677]
MPSFSAEVFQNEFISEGSTDVHAIVSVTCSGAGEAGRGEGGDAAEIIIVDTSGSMLDAKIVAARQAAAVAVDQILDGTWFAIISGTHVATRAFPYPNARVSMVQMEPGARAAAKEAISRLEADGGTAMGSWLKLAGQLFDTVPQATQRHAILLTDGQNQSEQPHQFQNAIDSVTGRFQCDCRGVGADWDVAELRRVSTALLGTVDLIADPASMAADFEQLMQKAMGRGVAEATLRVWAPQGSQVLWVRQVSPNVEDLSSRRVDVNPLTSAFPTGAWGDESRDYHVAVRVQPQAVGQERLAARVQLMVRDQVVSQGLVKAKWSGDDALTTRIDPAVAHYTGQAELASAIQEGLAAKAAGDEEAATAKLGRAVALAAETGNDEATSKLRKVVDIDDPATGTVRLKRSVDKLDEMALDTASTKTTRVNKR